MHALQDIYAHGNVTGRGGTHVFNHDNIRYDWKDFTLIEVEDSGQTHGQRYYATQTATIAHLNLFIDAIGGSLEYRYAS